MKRKSYVWIGAGALTAVLIGIGILASDDSKEPLRRISQSSPLNLLPHAEKPSEPVPIVSTPTHSSAPDARMEANRQQTVENFVESPSSPPATDKRAYLTFDDGPSRSTPQILEVLKEHNVKATFFVVGKTSEESKSLYRQIAKEGHAIGNHTYSHDYRKVYASVAAFKQDVGRLNDLLEETVGVRPDILRFPGGSNNHLSRKSGGRQIMPNIAREMSNAGYQYFDWNVSSTDAAAPVQEKELIIHSVKANSDGKKDIIVLMHDMDAKRTTVEALPSVIRYLKEQGYEFRTLKRDSFTYQFLKP
ncbi:polysaccharide deacetylase family protein [Paenibacillus silviterrae]|uniref:polysaccharide deacetylase family protein n=1 Tax=Paenibacillus silviterrae TaxID=3242194 RepID=UPI00254367EF|nr:polysaccharide deacetylase family protein [Paenibacillus chinjuensis]